MAALHDHVSDAALRDFLLGKIADSQIAEFEQHLSDCSECQSRAATACSEDTFIALLAAARTRLDAEQSHFATPSFALTAAYELRSGQLTNDDIPPDELLDHPRYRVVSRLGSGGMGSVWRAEHAVMKRSVAVKVIRPDLLAKPGAADRFLREVQAAASLHHPNIVTAFDAEECNGSCLLAMEYVPGETLSEVVKLGPLPVVEACRAIRDAARGLAHAHAAGLVHRDVKPGNLIRTTDGTVKVLDFGLVVADLDRESGLTGENMVIGTPDYIAPEQATDARTADARADIYSLGCTLYHLLAGRVPFPAESVLAKLDAHRDPARLPEPLADVPPELAAIVSKMMAKRPAARYQSAAVVAEQLEPWTSDMLSVRRGAQAHGGRTPRRSPRRWFIAAGLFFALIGFGVWGAQQVIVRDKNGKEVFRGTIPEGGSVEVKPSPAVNPVVRPPALPKADPLTGEIRKFTQPGTVRTVAYSPDGTQVLSGSGWPASDLTLRMWDVATGRLVWATRQPLAITAVAFAPDDRILVSGISQKVYVVDRKTGANLGTLEGEHEGEVFAIAVSPDGKFALTSSINGTAKIWDIATRKPIRELRTTVGLVVALAYSPDGTRAASVTAGKAVGTVRVWDVNTGAALFEDYQCGKDLVGIGLAFTPDGGHVLFAEGGAAVLWNFETGKVIRRFEGGIGGPRSGNAVVALAPGGQRLLTGGEDGIVRLFDIGSSKPVAEFRGHADRIWGVAFSPDGRFGLSGSGGRMADGVVEVGDDHTARVWQLPEPTKQP